MKLLLTGDSLIARKEGLKGPRLDYTLKKKNSNIETINTAVPGINSGAFFALISGLVLKIDHCDKLFYYLEQTIWRYIKRFHWSSLSKTWH